MTTTTTIDSERADLLAAIAKQRHFLRFTTRGLTDEAARQRTTVSELCLGGLIKHVTAVERIWADFIQRGPAAMSAVTEMTARDWERRAAEFRLLPDETLEGALAAYQRAARHTDEVVADISSLNDAWPLPEAPWFPPGECWSARRVLLHIIAETAQHCGHADIIRESLDGAKSMG
jgi:uncharacterized damage-inducible protein DinB